MAGSEVLGILSRGLSDLLLGTVVGGTVTLAALLVVAFLTCLAGMLIGEIRGGRRR